MLTFRFSPDGPLPAHAPTKYPELLQTEGTFDILINGRRFFSDPYFPIYEFLLQANEWMANEAAPDIMEYSSLETDENPLLCFRKTEAGNYSLQSPWESFENSIPFSFAEIREAINGLNRMMK